MARPPGLSFTRARRHFWIAIWLPFVLERHPNRATGRHKETILSARGAIHWPTERFRRRSAHHRPELWHGHSETEAMPPRNWPRFDLSPELSLARFIKLECRLINLESQGVIHFMPPAKTVSRGQTYVLSQCISSAFIFGAQEKANEELSDPLPARQSRANSSKVWHPPATASRIAFDLGDGRRVIVGSSLGGGVDTAENDVAPAPWRGKPFVLA